jgi:hypothetical protein
MNNKVLRVVDDFLTTAQCEEILASIRAYRSFHEAPLIDRAAPGRSLRYRVIDGNAVAQQLPDLELLYRRTALIIGAWAGK